jgi:hypothetical protein
MHATYASRSFSDHAVNTLVTNWLAALCTWWSQSFASASCCAAVLPPSWGERRRIVGAADDENAHGQDPEVAHRRPPCKQVWAVHNVAPGGTGSGMKAALIPSVTRDLRGAANA